MAPNVTISVPYTFVQKTLASSSQVNADFSEVATKFNAHTHLDLPDGLLNGLLLGNDLASNYGPNTGTPPGNVIPIKFQVLKGTPGVDLAQTQQGGVAWTKYRTRCIDDASESWSFGVLATDAWGPWPGPQTQPLTALEGDALVQGAVVLNGKAVAMVGGVEVQNTSHADTAIHFYAAQTSIDVGATITNRYGFYDEGTTGTGTITNKWSFYGKFRIQTEDSVVIGTGGANATQSSLWVQGTANAAHVAVVAAATGTSNLQEWRNSTNTAIAFFQRGGALMLASTAMVNTKLGIATSADVNSGVIIKANSPTQSADLWQLQDSTGAIMTAFQKDGKLVFGPSGSQDTNLYRSAASTLKTDVAMIVAGAFAANGGVTLADATDITIASTTGTKIGQASSKVGFYGATPIVQPAATSDLRVALINLGLLASGGATPLNLNGGALTASGITLNDATDVTIASVTGSKIGQSASKIGFYGTAPASRQAAYTQTYATATRTHSNPTATALTDAFGTADGTIADVGAAFSQTTLNNNFQDHSTVINALIADLANVKQLMNSVIDDLQLVGLLQ